MAHPHLQAERLRALQKVPRGARRINDAVMRNQQSASHSLSQIRLRFGQGRGVENFHGNAAGSIKIRLAPHLGHLFFVSRDPDRPALFIFDVARKFRRDLPPELL